MRGDYTMNRKIRVITFGRYLIAGVMKGVKCDIPRKLWNDTAPS